MAGPAHKQRRLASIKDACDYGRFSRAKLYRLIHAEKIDAYKDVGRTWVDLDTIDAYRNSLPKFTSVQK